MDLNELVRTITQEVLKQINKESEKECVMILENRECNLVNPVLEHMGEEADVLFLNDDSGNKKVSRYILPFLSCGRMADIAVGKTSEPIVEEILRLLLSGVQIEAFEYEYKSYSDTAPMALYNMYESYEEKLATFGLIPFTRKQKNGVRLRKSLITEKDVIQALEKGVSELLVPLNANITPLAVESAREQNVKLLKSK